MKLSKSLLIQTPMINHEASNVEPRTNTHEAGQFASGTNSHEAIQAAAPTKTQEASQFAPGKKKPMNLAESLDSNPVKTHEASKVTPLTKTHEYCNVKPRTNPHVIGSVLG
jgi:hypothetical protein